MLKSTKVLVAVASLMCTAASFSIAVSPALTATARQARPVIVNARAVPACYAANTQVQMFDLVE